MSQLARTGTAVLRQITATSQAVTVKVQGQGAMVTMSQRQYDEMIALIRRIQQETSDAGFIQALSQRFDKLVAGMNFTGYAALRCNQSLWRSAPRTGTRRRAPPDALHRSAV